MCVPHPRLQLVSGRWATIRGTSSNSEALRMPTSDSWPFVTSTHRMTFDLQVFSRHVQLTRKICERIDLLLHLHIYVKVCLCNSLTLDFINFWSSLQTLIDNFNTTNNWKLDFNIFANFKYWLIFLTLSFYVDWYFDVFDALMYLMLLVYFIEHWEIFWVLDIIYSSLGTLV